jgi:hypothetical protein
MLYFLAFIIGLLIGLFIMIIAYKKQTTYGEIDVDHYSGLVNFKADSTEVSKLYNKRIIFKINHNSVISRDEHTL